MGGRSHLVRGAKTLSHPHVLEERLACLQNWLFPWCLAFQCQDFMGGKPPHRRPSRRRLLERRRPAPKELGQSPSSGKRMLGCDILRSFFLYAHLYATILEKIGPNAHGSCSSTIASETWSHAQNRINQVLRGHHCSPQAALWDRGTS